MWCAASEAWRFHQVSSAPESSQHPKLHTPHWQALACQRHYDIASTFCAPSVWSGFWHLSCAFLWRGTRRGNHTDSNRNLFCLGLQTIGVGFVLEASLLNVGHQHGKNNFWKSSWLRKEIVSHVQGFTRPYKNKQAYLFWPAGATKKLTITMTISDESHWSMSRRLLLLFHGHTHLVSGGNA